MGAHDAYMRHCMVGKGLTSVYQDTWNGPKVKGVWIRGAPLYHVSMETMHTSELCTYLSLCQDGLPD